MIKNSLRSVIVLSIIVFLCGCATWVRTQPKEFKDNPRGFSAILPDGWMRYAVGNQFLITKDGVILNVITVEKRKIKEKLEHTKKIFDASMLPVDIADVEIDNLKSNQIINRFELLANEAVNISGQQGFHLSYQFTTNSGLVVKGEHYGMLYKDWVYRIVFEAPEQFYYSRDRGAFDVFLKSFTLQK